MIEENDTIQKWYDIEIEPASESTIQKVSYFLYLLVWKFQLPADRE